MHDVIAHTLTISLLHVTSARLAVEYDPDYVARSLAEAERLGRESLDEVRATVGLLSTRCRRRERTHRARRRARRRCRRWWSGSGSAGADVTLAVHGDTDGLPVTAGLAVYRILQEALTNAIKHAPGAPTAAILTVGADAVELTVDSAGQPGPGTGLGVISMRERAGLSGGRCEAGPGGRGWLVRGTLPLQPAGSREAAP